MRFRELTAKSLHFQEDLNQFKRYLGKELKELIFKDKVSPLAFGKVKFKKDRRLIDHLNLKGVIIHKYTSSKDLQVHTKKHQETSLPDWNKFHLKRIYLAQFL